MSLGNPSSANSLSHRRALPSYSGLRIARVNGHVSRILPSSFGEATRRSVCYCQVSSLDLSRNSESKYTWDVLGLGQAMVDFQGVVSKDMIRSLDLVSGQRQVVGHEARGRVLSALDGGSYKVSAGGSLSNTLVALARLCAKSSTSAPRVGLIASVGSDALGDFYRAKMKKAGVSFLSEPIENGTTGTVVVLTSDDAERTMLSYQGMSSMLMMAPDLEAAVTSTRVLLVEGYLWEIPQTIAAIRNAVSLAKRSGALVALSTSDVSCVRANLDDFLDFAKNHADIVFSNADEACALTGEATPAAAAAALGAHCTLAVVTNGRFGSYLSTPSATASVPAVWCDAVDACGAGDAYAAGVIYSLLRGGSVGVMGEMGARVASVVVSRRGARLREEDAAMLVAANEGIDVDNTLSPRVRFAL